MAIHPSDKRRIADAVAAFERSTPPAAVSDRYRIWTFPARILQAIPKDTTFLPAKYCWQECSGGSRFGGTVDLTYDGNAIGAGPAINLAEEREGLLPFAPIGAVVPMHYNPRKLRHEFDWAPTPIVATIAGHTASGAAPGILPFKYDWGQTLPAWSKNPDGSARTALAGNAAGSGMTSFAVNLAELRMPTPTGDPYCPDYSASYVPDGTPVSLWWNPSTNIAGSGLGPCWCFDIVGSFTACC